ncbi:MAG: AAA family ATPase [bacterium]|nr:AAA family ATPase [bacterium]
MSTKIAITGKSGSGKTTIAKAFLNVIKGKFPDKSILLFDNDLSGELGHSYGLDIRNTIYGIRSGKHEYKTGIPEHMTKQEFIDWAMEDIIVSIDDNVDLIVSWLPGVKDCRCPITEQISYAVKRVLKRYDFIIFDCEFDLKYLMQLVDIDIDLSLIVANPTIESIKLAARISEYSAKYAAGGQMGIIINKVLNQDLSEVSLLAKKSEIDVLGTIPYDEIIGCGSTTRESAVVQDAIKQLYCRLNLPQGEY